MRIAIGSSVPVGDGSYLRDVDTLAEEDPAPLAEPTPGDAPDGVAPPAVTPPPKRFPPSSYLRCPRWHRPSADRLLPVAAPDPAQLALIPVPTDSPEDVVAAAAEAHPGRNGVAVLSERLVKGINTKSGSCLRDLSDLAHDLFIELRDPDNALAVADILNVLPYDGNRDRWMSVERALALSSFICRELGQTERGEVYDQLLQAPDTVETDPFKARIAAKVRQRGLNEPNLYDKEIFRSIDNGNRDAEREWRLLRLETLLFLRSHGGSNTLGVGELDHRIANELEAVRS